MNFFDRLRQIATIGVFFSPVIGGIVAGAFLGGPIGAVIGGVLGVAALATVVSALGSTFGPEPQKPHQKAIVNGIALIAATPDLVKKRLGTAFNQKKTPVPPVASTETKPKADGPQTPAA